MKKKSIVVGARESGCGGGGVRRGSGQRRGGWTKVRYSFGSVSVQLFKFDEADLAMCHVGREEKVWKIVY